MDNIEKMVKIELWDCATGELQLEIKCELPYESCVELADNLLRMEMFRYCDYEIIKGE